MRIFGPGATVAQDLEPEYITVDCNNRLAYVALQENNAMAVINIRRARCLSIIPFRLKDHGQIGNGIDASNKDKAININNWPVFGMYLPDAIASYKWKGRTLIVTANEGDARDYDGYSEEERVKNLVLDEDVFSNPAELQSNKNLGRLKTTTALPVVNDDGEFMKIYAYGGRSFSIFTKRGKLLFDSGDDFEQITAGLLPDYFNSDNDDNNSFDSRSDDKGPEPEALAIGRIKGNTFAFIGLERIGGIMVYNITNPHSVKFVTYINNRDFTLPAKDPQSGDLGVEGLVFVKASQSPNKRPLLIASNEVSGTVTVFQISSSR